MIAVIADDFTGAAEMAGIAHRYDLLAEVRTTGRDPSAVDVMVIDTHTRSASREEAERRVSREVRSLREAGVEWVYKKVDSVLRGHVVPELTRVFEGLGIDRALLVPANPSYGQVIREGRYMIDGRPLAETPFGSDPEYPAVSSHVLDLLGSVDGVPVTWASGHEALEREGIVVSSGDDTRALEGMARRMDAGTLAAGGAEFFAATLRVRLGLTERATVADEQDPPPRKVVFVLGSGSRRAREMLERARAEGVPVVGVLPDPNTPTVVDGPVTEALDGMKARGRIVLAFDPHVNATDGQVRDLPRRLAALARAVHDRAPEPDIHWLVDGGTTASTVVRVMGWERFAVRGVEGRGLVTLAVLDGSGRLVTVKPGSYPWPEKARRWLR